VAIKVMHGLSFSDDESLKRYHTEAKAASRLNHHKTNSIYDFGVDWLQVALYRQGIFGGKAAGRITLQERGQNNNWPNNDGDEPGWSGYGEDMRVAVHRDNQNGKTSH